MYVADGYFNRRVVVIDADTGKFKRYWGAYGEKPDDDATSAATCPTDPPAKQFRGPVHCAEHRSTACSTSAIAAPTASRCSARTAPTSRKCSSRRDPVTGSTWDVAFSEDEQQRFMYLADGQNMKVHVMERSSMQVLTTFGGGGRQPGLFFAVH